MTALLTAACLGGALVSFTLAACPHALSGLARSARGRGGAFLAVFAALMLHAAVDKPEDSLKVMYGNGLKPPVSPVRSVGTNDVAYLHWALEPDYAKGGGPIPGSTPVVVLYALDDGSEDPDWQTFSSNEVVAADLHLEKSVRGTPLVPIGAPDAVNFRFVVYSLYVPPPDVVTNLTFSGVWTSTPGSPIVPVGAVFVGDTNSVSPPAIERREP